MRYEQAVVSGARRDDCCGTSKSQTEAISPARTAA